MNAHAIRDEHDWQVQQIETEALLKIKNHADVVAAIRAIEQAEKTP